MALKNGLEKGVITATVALAVCCGNVHARKINLAEVFLESSRYQQCVELQFEGFAVFLKIAPSFLTGVSVRIIASPITSHYNPDYLVTSYPRLGSSPSLESFVVFGALQNLMSEPVVELLSGVEAPVSYSDIDLWGTPGSEAQNDNTKSILRYYETEVLGHPGNIYTAVSRGLNGETPIDIDNLASVITEIPRQIATLPSVLAGSASQLANGARDLGAGFPDLQGVGFNPVEWGVELFGDTVTHLYSQLPTDVLGTLGDIASSSGAEVGAVITGAINDAQNFDIGEEISGALDNVSNPFAGEDSEADGESDGSDVGGGDDDAGGAGPGLLDIDVSGLPDRVSQEVTDYFAGLTPNDVLGFVAPDIADTISEVMQLVETYDSFATSISSSGDAAGGIAGRFEPWSGLCPSDTSPMVPYFLSGMNVPGWRFKIPELVYPQTYVPFSNSTTVGNFSPLAALGLGGGDQGEQHNYGSVYPRNGYLMQADSVKGAAVAAFRAAHIVSRPGQPYVYTNPPQQENKYEFFMFDNDYEDFDSSSGRRGDENSYLEPDKPESGRWQLIHSEGGELDNSCQIFGDASVNPDIPLVDASNITGYLSNVPLVNQLLPDNGLPEQWSEGKQSEDHQYAFNLWKRYRCAPDPGDSGSATSHLFNLVLPTITVIEQGE